jgi:CubicO group peptidase (beta-lactamase class C family)
VKIKLTVSPLIFILLFSVAVAAAELPTAPPESVGLSSERLNRITETLRTDIAKGAIPGAVVLISRQGKIAYFEAVGSLDPQVKTLMGKDAIFRIYSMTKPITTILAMMLVEQGKLVLADPVAKYIPQFKDVKVGEEKRDSDGKVTLELIAPNRTMTIQDLMRHTSGLTYGFFGEGAVKRAYLDAKLNEGDPDNSEFVDRLAKLPLVYQPGTTWEYSQATDVLGRVIEVVTGKSLYQAMREMLLDPLGMVDTSFYVTDPTKHSRIAEPFTNDRTIGAGAQVSDPRAHASTKSGGGGLVSTARLRPIPADACQRRHVRRQALRGSEDHRLYDLRPHGRRNQARAL